MGPLRRFRGVLDPMTNVIYFDVGQVVAGPGPQVLRTAACRDLHRHSELTWRRSLMTDQTTPAAAASGLTLFGRIAKVAAEANSAWGEVIGEPPGPL